MTKLTRKFRGLAVAAAVVLLASGCNTEDQVATQPAPVQGEAEPGEPDTESVQDDAPPQDGTGATEVSIPAGAVPASADFPFPVPEGWAVLDEFAPDRVGKSDGMFGAYEYPGAASDAAQTFQDLLIAAGYTIHPDLLGSTVHEAAFIVEGPVNGTPYSGGILFNTQADGYQKASIILTVDD